MDARNLTWKIVLWWAAHSRTCCSYRYDVGPSAISRGSIGVGPFWPHPTAELALAGSDGYNRLSTVQIAERFRKTPPDRGSVAERSFESTTGRKQLCTFVPIRSRNPVFRTLLSLALLAGGAMTVAAEVVVYPAPEGEVLSTDYEVWADGKKVDVYTARTLDPPFAGKQWITAGLTVLPAST